jgi:hypothetical protein
MRSRRALLRFLCLGALAAPVLASPLRVSPLRVSPLHAQDAPLGWTAAPPSVVDDRVVAIAIGAAHDDDGPLAAARLAARRRGHARGLAQIARWADDALSRSGVGPRDAQAVHDAIASTTRTARIRARADGSAIVEVRCPLSALREAFDHPALPWHRA